jgi:1-acyl-sn-glycerol-3-phosphate acyltransferase
MRKEVPSGMKSPNPNRIFGPFYKLCRTVWRVTHNRQPVLGMENIGELPAIFVGRHQDLYGPVEIMAWVPLDFRVWTLYKFMSVKECYRHYRDYTYSVRRGYKPLAAKVRAAVAAPFVSAFMNSMGGIPVYRGCRNIADTFKMSVKALRRGESILIMPERDYTDTGSDAGEMYAGFVHVAQLYCKATGKALSFYPVYPSKQYGKIYVEKPIVFDPAKPFRAERDRIVGALKAELSGSAIEKDFHIATADKTKREAPESLPGAGEGAPP